LTLIFHIEFRKPEAHDLSWHAVNRADDEQYIIRLLGQVITVSVETVKIVKSLPELKF
jgi:predicted helicase